VPSRGGGEFQDFSFKFCTPEALQPIAPGRAKHAPGEWRIEMESAPRRGAKIRESSTPAGVGDTLEAQLPGSLRTPGYPLQRLRRTPGTAIDFKVAAPAVTTFTQEVTAQRRVRAPGLQRHSISVAPLRPEGAAQESPGQRPAVTHHKKRDRSSERAHQPVHPCT
jgi:hypothetical protein